MANRKVTKDTSDNIIASAVMASSIRSGAARIIEAHASDVHKVTVNKGSYLIPVQIGNFWFLVDTATHVDAVTDIDTGSVAATTAYYVYAVTDESTITFKTSINATNPTGYDTAHSNLLGGFTTDGSSDITATTIWDVKLKVTTGGYGMSVDGIKLPNQGMAPTDGPTFAHTHLTDAIADNLSTNQAATTAFVQRALYLNTPMYYGVSWDESADTYVRTGSLAGLAAGSKPLEALLHVQAKMRRCVINDAGVVQYYLCATNSAYKEDGITASVLTGADGQVMVEIPKFWYRHSYAGTTHTWEVSPISLAGFDVNPAFMSGATELDYIYAGAYEGILFDTSTGLYDSYATGDVLDFTATTGDKLSSVTAKVPVSNGTRANFRAIAANRGPGWTQELYDMRSAVQLLYLTEYASFNSQSVLGLGICNVNDWAATSYYPFAPSGNSNGIGNATGNTAGAVAGTASEASKYMSYRGIENFYGHLWKWLDGINTNSNRSYICNVAANLADDTASNYTDIGINNKADDGYQNTLLNISRGFLPANTADADAATKITDYYYQAAGWRVASSGGSAADAVYDGAFCLILYYDSAGLSARFGARLWFRK